MMDARRINVYHIDVTARVAIPICGMSYRPSGKLHSLLEVHVFQLLLAVVYYTVCQIGTGPDTKESPRYTRALGVYVVHYRQKWYLNNQDECAETCDKSLR